MISLLIIVFVVRWIAQTRPEERLRLLALGMILGGAVGNLISRLYSSQGVVDFIDIGAYGWRFWTFNVADSAITIGAVLFVWDEWTRRPRHQENTPASTRGPER